jgi:hypothetical protein
MSPNNKDLGRDLGRAMHDRVDGLDVSGLTLDDVKGRASRIRRRQAATAGAVVAVVLAIAVPTALTAGGSFTGADRDTPPATNSPPVEPTPTGTHEDVLDTRNLPQGEAPRIPWLDGTRLHVGEDTLDLDAGYDAVAVLGDRYVATLRGETSSVVVLDASGSETATYPLESSGLVVNRAGTAVAWVAPDGTPHVVQADLDEPVRMSPAEGDNAQVLAIIGDDCATDPESTEGGGCTVFFSTDSATGRTTWGASSHGFTDVARPEGQALLDAESEVDGAGGFLALSRPVDDMAWCSELTRSESGRVWETCDFMPLAFSPDGEHVLATHPVGYEGFGTSQLTVLTTADGEPVLDLKATVESQATITDMVWEDGSHVLARVFQEGRWTVIRVGLDGSVEYAVAPVPGADLEGRFVLAAQP